MSKSAPVYEKTHIPNDVKPGDNPYLRFRKNELILRDELAIDRTILANERTVLSYLRGAMALIIAGVTFVHFINAGWLLYLGMSLVPFGLLIAVIGIMRYRSMHNRIQAIRCEIHHKDAPESNSCA
jgi:putative membrane protein